MIAVPDSEKFVPEGGLHEIDLIPEASVAIGLYKTVVLSDPLAVETLR